MLKGGHRGNPTRVCREEDYSRSQSRDWFVCWRYDVTVGEGLICTVTN